MWLFHSARSVTGMEFWLAQPLSFPTCHSEGPAVRGAGVALIGKLRLIRVRANEGSHGARQVAAVSPGGITGGRY